MEVFDQKVNNMICPKCGCQLVERSGIYGKFLGCSAYPNCNFKKNITEKINEKTFADHLARVHDSLY